ncbi:hypothetical protein AMAG_06322 [Allomyces macrogynus ATCC 38327]|uniref:Homeobox domain-containing protein n=1 Tax=Allomyces macrogynus (strain ATCC 38327) TaxID=578462 RepID=A0A0L0SGM7_ALLM3|nr:hypothetical protein AMAG_06322 [Allomyces macrogynus ATCC 38327]|eukprot:KNE61505.1 hypothetical protein AMAG_06322 [Allomyces macrogynus ATCC 38327]
MEVRARIARHALFPLVTEMTVYRHRASVATSTTEMQKILAGVSDSVERHFADHGGDKPGAVPPAPNPVPPPPMVMFLDTLSDTQIDHLVRSAVVILISHILEFHEHVEALEAVFEGVLVRAANEFNALIGGASMLGGGVVAGNHPSAAMTAGGLGGKRSMIDEPPGPDGQKKRAKRTNHRPEVTELLRNWVTKHENHPYPDEEQKKLLCELTKLSREQLDHWFINARRRFLKDTKAAREGNPKVLKYRAGKGARARKSTTAAAAATPADPAAAAAAVGTPEADVSGMPLPPPMAPAAVADGTAVGAQLQLEMASPLMASAGPDPQGGAGEPMDQDPPGRVQ